MADDQNHACQNDFSKILVDIPLITDCVLEKLPMCTLNNCARVCKQWNKAVQKLKRQRQQSLWLLFTLPSNYFTDAPSVQVSDQISDRLKVMSSEPSTAILFLSTSAFEQSIPIPSASSASSSSKPHPRACKQERTQVTTYLKRSLPKSCTLVGMSTDGIIGTMADVCRPQELENSGAGSLLLLPDVKGLGIHTFTLTEDAFDVDLTETDSLRETLEQLCGIPTNANVKALFLFFAVDSPVVYTESEVAFSSAFVREYKDIVVSGGYVDNLIYLKGNRSQSPRDVAVGIVFYGDDIKMASKILDQSVKTTKEAEECMKLLKDTHIPLDCSHHCFGFQFACVGRGFHQYHQNGVEADAFKKFFPNVPLFGFFGNGELGFDYLPDYSKDPPETPKNHPDPNLRLNHSYTTIMSVLSIPKH